MKLGDKVAYSATFLRSIGWRDAGRLCSWRGVVLSVELDPLYRIGWLGGPIKLVNVFNLVNVNAPGGLNADVEKSRVWGYNERLTRHDV